MNGGVVAFEFYKTSQIKNKPWNIDSNLKSTSDTNNMSQHKDQVNIFFTVMNLMMVE